MFKIVLNECLWALLAGELFGQLAFDFVGQVVDVLFETGSELLLQVDVVCCEGDESINEPRVLGHSLLVVEVNQCPLKKGAS